MFPVPTCHGTFTKCNTLKHKTDINRLQPRIELGSPSTPSVCTTVTIGHCLRLFRDIFKSVILLLSRLCLLT